MQTMMILMVGCTTLGDPVLFTGADSDRQGDAGADGAFGAAVVSMAAPARVTDVVPVDVIYPTLGEAPSGDTLTPAVQNAPTVVLIHGGFVPPERYWWLAAHFATRGYVSVMPRAELDLALLQAGNGAIALDALRAEAGGDGLLAGIVAADGPIATMGHSLGGTTAARHWTRDEDIDLLVMLASFAAPSDPIEDQGSRPVLALSGTTDGSLEVDQYLEGSERYAEGGSVWLQTGMNHYGWTDGTTDFEAGRDGPLEGDLDVLRAQAQALIDAYLDVHLTGADTTRLDVDFAGMEEVP